MLKYEYENTNLNAINDFVYPKESGRLRMAGSVFHVLLLATLLLPGETFK